MIKENKHVIFCHGSLITNNVILSAAHCFKDQAVIPKLFVVLGVLEPLKEGSPPAERQNKKRKIKSIHEIDQVFLHNDYKLFRKEAYHDLALVKLKEKVKLNKYLHPICLPLSHVVQNDDDELERSLQSQSVIVTGFRTESPLTDGLLHFIEPQIQTQDFCNHQFFNSSNPSDNQVIDDALPQAFQSSVMCAAVETGNEASCQGDSGAPLFRYEFINGTEKRYIQLGTLHGSVNTCDNRYPGIYSRLEDPSNLAFVKSSYDQIIGNLVYTASSVGM